MGSDYQYDAFLSYSTVPDYRLARRLESFLEGFHRLDEDGGLGLRQLTVCRDASDFPSPVRTRRQRLKQRTTGELIDRSDLGPCLSVRRWQIVGPGESGDQETLFEF